MRGKAAGHEVVDVLFAHKSLSEEELEEVGEHLQSCADCVERIESLDTASPMDMDDAAFRRRLEAICGSLLDAGPPTRDDAASSEARPALRPALPAAAILARWSAALATAAVVLVALQVIRDPDKPSVRIAPSRPPTASAGPMPGPVGTGIPSVAPATPEANPSPGLEPAPLLRPGPSRGEGPTLHLRGGLLVLRLRVELGEDGPYLLTVERGGAEQWRDPSLRYATRDAQGRRLIRVSVPARALAPEEPHVLRLRLRGADPHSGDQYEFIVDDTAAR